MNNKNHSSFYALAIIFLLSACKAQVKPIGQAPLDLLNFDFETKAIALYPDQYKSKKWDNFYDIPVGDDTRLVQRDTSFTDQFGENQKAVGLEFRQISSSSADTLALATDVAFSSISVATSLEGKINAIGAEVSEITEADSKKFINALTEKYGASKKLEGDFMTKFVIYQWETDSQVFRYATIFTDEKNAVKLEVDQDKGTIKGGERTPHHDGYFFVIDKNFMKDLGTLHTGIFVYIK